MLKTLILSQNITANEAFKYSAALHLIPESNDSNSKSTTAFAHFGFPKIGVWLNPEMNAAYNRTSTLYVIVDAVSFTVNNELDLSLLTQKLNPILARINLFGNDWRIQNLYYEKAVSVINSAIYLDLLNRGHSLSSYKMKKTVNYADKKISALIYNNSESNLYINASSIDTITLSLSVDKFALKYASSQLGLNKRYLNSYIGHFCEIEKYFFTKYISGIAGTSNYSSLEKLEQSLAVSELSISQKKNLINSAKGIACYKGIDNFLAHIEDPAPRYEFMNNPGKRSTIERNLAKYDKLGFNPIVLSVRQIKSISGSEELPNLIHLI